MLKKEAPGVLSSYLERMRFKNVLPVIKIGSVILDIGCGKARIIRLLPNFKKYIGIDYVAPKHVKRRNCRFIRKKLDISILKKMKFSVDYILLLAFLEHLKNPDEFVGELVNYLNEEGKIIITTPCPIGKDVYSLGSKLGLFSTNANEEHDRFLSKNDLYLIAKNSCLTVDKYKKFLFGFNQLVVYKKR